MGGTCRGPRKTPHRSRRIGSQTMCGVLELLWKANLLAASETAGSKRPREALLGESLQQLTGHYSPRLFMIVQRYHFYCRAQKDEAMKDLVMRKLTAETDCGSRLTLVPSRQELYNNLRDRLVQGLRDYVMRKHPLEDPELMLDRAVKIVASMEAAAEGARQMTGQK